MRLFLDTKTRLFYLFKILVTTTTISAPKKIRKTIVSTLLQRQRRGTLQRVGCCALGQLSQSLSWYLSVCRNWAKPISYSWTLASK